MTQIGNRETIVLNPRCSNRAVILPVTGIRNGTELQDEMKRKLRGLKKLECKIRFGGAFHASNCPEFSNRKAEGVKLVWNEFFHEGGLSRGQARYSLQDLVRLSKEQYRSVVEEYFFHVYYRYYTENGISGAHLYDPEILGWMGLGPGAGYEEIKKKFRELAKKYHPDAGGDQSRFIELMERYNKLME